MFIATRNKYYLCQGTLMLIGVRNRSLPVLYLLFCHCCSPKKYEYLVGILLQTCTRTIRRFHWTFLANIALSYRYNLIGYNLFSMWQETIPRCFSNCFYVVLCVFGIYLLNNWAMSFVYKRADNMWVLWFFKAFVDLYMWTVCGTASFYWCSTYPYILYIHMINWWLIYLQFLSHTCTCTNGTSIAYSPGFIRLTSLCPTL